MNKTRVLVVDDHPFFRCGLAHWLSQQRTLTCCGEVGSIAAARRAVAELKPDIILLDLRLEDGDGLDFTRELGAHHPEARVIIVSQSDEEAYAYRAIRVGARGYVMKTETMDVVRNAIETVLRGEVFVSRSAAARMLHNLFPDPASPVRDLVRLTDRELQVFQLLGTGCNSREIAHRLKISVKTVDTHREHLKDKLGLADAAALLKAATAWVEQGKFDAGGTNSRELP